jgi:hypothetical protein
MKQRHHDDLPEILWSVKRHGFAIFEEGDYNLNIIGIRNTANPQPNEFDDFLVVAYKREGEWITEEFSITTDPGRYWLQKPDYKPCAVYYHPQQARGAYKIGKHRGQYVALVQAKPVKFWRDADKDDHATYSGRIHEDRIGLNIHRSSTRENGSKYVDRWSAGCQVFADPADFARFMTLCDRQVRWTGYRSFTYTLISNEEI